MVKRNKKLSKKIQLNKVWVAIAILFALQLAMAACFIQFHDGYMKTSDGEVYRLINRVEKDRYKEPVISVSDNKVYIPELRIAMPLNDISRNLLYDFRTEGSKITSLILSVRDAVGNQNPSDHFSCDRMVTVTLSSNENAADGVLVDEIASLENGLRYIFQNQNNCSIHPHNASDKLVDVAKLIRQY